MASELIAVCLVVVVAVLRIVRLISVVKHPKLIGLPPKCEGFAAPGWNRVAEVFRRHVESGYHRGGGFAVYHKGRLVVEFVGGYADYKAEWPWDKTTLSCLYGCTKGIGATVIAILVDRGLLDYSSPVANYWPEFGVNGKESITVEQLLSHQAGLVILDEVYSLFDMKKNSDKMSHLLATARPQWEPGSKHGFHGITIGLYMDQLVRRVDPQHRSLAQFFAEEVALKFGIDCFIGLPKEENYRCARHVGFSLLCDLVMTIKYWLWDGWGESERYMNKTLDNYAEIDKSLDNNPAFREIPCASMHGYSTVAGLAKLYGILANGGRYEDQTLLSPSAVEKLNEPLVSGFDFIFSMDTTYGRGTSIVKSKDGHNIFGHSGFCGQAGLADPKHGLGWAYISNYSSLHSYSNDWKYRQLIEMVYETVRELEQQEHND